MSEWLVWTQSAEAPSLGSIEGVARARLQRRRYSTDTWPATARCVASRGWVDAQPDASVVDGLPLVSAALKPALDGAALWPVAVTYDGEPIAERWAVMPRVLADALPPSDGWGPTRAIAGLTLDSTVMARVDAGLIGIRRLPNVVLVSDQRAQRLWECGASGLDFTAPSDFRITFGAPSPAEHARLEALLAEAHDAGARVATELGRAPDGRPLNAWLGEMWLYRGAPHFEQQGMDPAEFVDEVEAAWTQALAKGLRAE